MGLFIFIGCFAAIENKHLEKLTIWFHEKHDRPEIVKEAYVFKFEYLDDEGNEFARLLQTASISVDSWSNTPSSF